MIQTKPIQHAVFYKEPGKRTKKIGVIDLVGDEYVGHDHKGNEMVQSRDFGECQKMLCDRVLKRSTATQVIDEILQKHP